jgi:hypothetical protein
MTTTLRVPRRYHRPLLLPHGLVALGFLLLIGCRVLVNHSGLHRYVVMHLTMPTICNDQKDTYTFCAPSAREISNMGFWQTADFTGNPTTDSSNLRLIQHHLRAVYYHSTTSGLQVRFHARARYGSLVDALDEVNMSNAPSYFIDTHSPITTLYVLPLRYESTFPTISEISEGERLSIETAPTTTGISRWLDRISSHLAKPAWATGLLAAASIWLLIALGRWQLQN